MPDHPIRPSGGAPVDLLVSPERAAEIRAASKDWPSWELDPAQTADLELLLGGWLSPLRGYMGRAEAESAAARSRLPDGTFWPAPWLLEVGESLAGAVRPGSSVALRDREGVMLAALEVREVWKGERPCLAGPIEGVQSLVHHDFPALRKTAAQLRADPGPVAAWQGGSPLHRDDVRALEVACRERGARLLLQPPVGGRDPGDRAHYARIRCLRAARSAFPAGLARLALLPLSPRGGPAEALLRAVVARNSGCDHLFLDPSLAGAAELLDRHRAETGVVPLPAPFRPRLSEEELLGLLDRDRPLPEGFTFPEVERELRGMRPPARRRGFTVFFTGLSGAGKSTLAQILRVRLLERGGRSVTLLDGDHVRKHLSSELGFSREHRDLNIRRIGFVASEITRHGGAAICSPIAPYEAVRREVREMVEPAGGFVLIHVSTPLEICEARDRKGLYAKARAGLVKAFTGISDPYEPPPRPEVVIDTSSLAPDPAVELILAHLESRGYLETRDGA